MASAANGDAPRWLLDDLPGLVRLPAGPPDRSLFTPVDEDRGLELAAILATIGDIGSGWRVATGVAGVRIAPRRRLPGPIEFKRVLGRFLGIGAVGLVEGLSDLAAKIAASQGAERDRGELTLAAADLRAGKCPKPAPRRVPPSSLFSAFLARNERQPTTRIMTERGIIIFLYLE